MINPEEHPLHQQRDLEGLLRDTWHIYKKHFGWLFLYSFLGITVLQSFLFTSRLKEFMTFDYLTNPDMISGQMGSLFMLVIVFFIGYCILYLFLHYYIIYQEWKPENNHFILIKDSIRKFALPYLATMFIAFAILIVGMMLGVMLLIIGMFLAMIYFATIFTPTSTLLIVEEASPLDAITRSFKLVHKNLWKTLGYIIVFYLLYFVIGIVLSSITMAPFAGNFFDLFNRETTTELVNASNSLTSDINPAYILVSSATSAVTTPFVPIFSILIYFKLKSC